MQHVIQHVNRHVTRYAAGRDAQRGWRRFWWGAVVAGALLAGGVHAVLPAGAVAAPESPVREVQVSRASIAVRGMATVPLTVRVRLVDPAGVKVGVLEEFVVPQGPLVLLRRSTGAGSLSDLLVGLKRASGTEQDGWWEGTLQVPSTADGQWTVTQVVLVRPGSCTGGGRSSTCDVIDVPAGLQRTVRVTGTHRPAVSIEFSPSPVRGDGLAPVQLKGRVFDSETGAGFAGAPVGICVETGCEPFIFRASGPARPYVHWPARRSTRSGPAGGYSFTLSRMERAPEVRPRYLAVWGPLNSDGLASTILGQTHNPDWYPVVSATLARSSAPLGTPVTVTGGVQQSVGCPVLLQRKVNGVWATVNTSTVDPSERYSVIAQPPTRGTFTYRVKVTACGGYLPQMHDGTSGSRTLTVT